VYSYKLVATRCKILQYTHTATTSNFGASHTNSWIRPYSKQHAATFYNTLQLFTTHSNTLQLPRTLEPRTLTRRFALTRSNTLQHSTAHCNTLQLTRTLEPRTRTRSRILAGSNTLQHSTTHCNYLQHTQTHCNYPELWSLAHELVAAYWLEATRCNILQHTATFYNTLKHTATHCN